MAYQNDHSVFDSRGLLVASGSRNRVLRNTYALLALSMIPTVLGSYLGVRTGFAWFSGFTGLIGFLVIAYGSMFLIERNKNNSFGVLLLLGFTFFMGLMLSQLLASVLGLANGGRLIMAAFGGTAMVFAGMATLATVSKRDFSGLGRWLFVGFLVVMVASIANIWLQLPALSLAMSVIIIGISSAFILIDVQRVINGGETNYISATLSIYLSIYNIFANLLSLLGIFGGERD
jgi:modulator of FtsH protease